MALPAGAPSWRSFNFFESTLVKDSQDLLSNPVAFKDTNQIACITPSSSGETSNSGGVLVADHYGRIKFLNSDFRVLNEWIAYGNLEEEGLKTGGRCSHMIESRGVLITLGEEGNSSNPILKIWDLLNISKQSGRPALLKSVKVLTGGSARVHPVSTIALTPTLTHLAVALGDGTVLLYRHLSQSLSSPSSSGGPSATAIPTANSIHSLPKPKVVLEENSSTPTEPITLLSFSHSTAKTSTSDLFITTPTRTFIYPVNGKHQPRIVEEIGSGLYCGTTYPLANGILLGKDEGLVSLNSGGRDAVIALEGPKTMVKLFGKSDVVIVSPPPSTTTNSRRGGPSSAGGVTMFDLEGKFISWSSNTTSALFSLPEGVKDSFENWGAYFIIGNDGKVIKLEPLPLQQKLDHLFSKALYPLALTLASGGSGESVGGSVDPEKEKKRKDTLIDIHRRYGDHLYLKGDFDGAVGEYVKTFGGQVGASYVIRKFLDAQRINNLITYLQELHAANLANSDHTTLLLNCYTKTSDLTRLDAFLKTSVGPATSASGVEAEKELPFDLETAIKVLRQAGLYEKAGWLARRFGRGEEYLRIQIEDLGAWKEGLRFLKGLPPDLAQENMLKYGKALLSNQPSEATDFLIDLCCGDHGEKSKKQPHPVDPTAAEENSPAYFANLLNLGRNGPGPAQPPTNGNGPANESPKLAPAMTQRSSTYARNDSSPPSELEEPITSTSYTPPSPQLFFAHFIDIPDHFMNFLESVALKRWGQKVDMKLKPAVASRVASNHHSSAALISQEEESDDLKDQKAVWNTLLELYLYFSNHIGPLSLDTMKLKLVKLLEQGTSIPFDVTHALIVCSTSDFTEGLVGIWERLGMYEDVLRFWIDQENECSSTSTPHDGSNESKEHASDRVIQHLHLYGPTNPNLYPLVLRFLTSSHQLITRHSTDLKDILRHIDEERIMPTVQVIQVLSRNNISSVGIVKDWLTEKIREMRQDVNSDQSLIASYRAETAAKQKEIQSLSDTSKPEIFQVARCASCGGTLDLPSIHFMCKHSFHQRCLGDAETCPIDSRLHGNIREIRANNARLAPHHDVFVQDVEDAEDGFEVVSSAFQRGLFDVGTTAGA